MKKTLHDRLYLRYGLFHRRWGHAIAYMIEFLLVAFCCALVLAFVLALARYTAHMFLAQERAEQVAQEKDSIEKTLLTCLNGGVIGRAGNEVITCEKAMTFQLTKVN